MREKSNNYIVTKCWFKSCFDKNTYNITTFPELISELSIVWCIWAECTGLFILQIPDILQFKDMHCLNEQIVIVCPS